MRMLTTLLGVAALAAALIALPAGADPAFADDGIEISVTAKNADGDKLKVEVEADPPGVCGMTGEVKFKDGMTGDKTEHDIIRSSVSAAGSSEINLHDDGMGCVGSTADPVVTINLVDGPGVTVTYHPLPVTFVLGTDELEIEIEAESDDDDD